MKIASLVFTTILSIAWLYLLNISISKGDQKLPPLGKFFSPRTGFWQNQRLDDMKAIEEIKDQKFKGEIILDDECIPHIFANDLANAYYLQGYIHAKFRLWQMDFSTRAAEGRISEIIGPKAIDFDKTRRRKGFAESAKTSVEVWKKFPESFNLIEAYVAGVNAYIQKLDYSNYPIEYKLMNFAPEKWTAYKSALFHKNMADVLCGREYDIELTAAKEFFGSNFEKLFPEQDKLLDPVIPKGTKWNLNQDSLVSSKNNKKNLETGFRRIEVEPKETGLGSNNWAVNSFKTENKNPILCNDPHLSFTLPSIWFEQQIITPDRNVYGVTFPGIPGIVIGFNEYIAWGVTNGGWDVMDWYSIQWKDNKKEKYLYDNEWINIETRIEKIKVKDAEEISDTVKLTKWGPIVYDGTHPKKDLAMHWIISEASTSCELDVFVDLNKAKNVNEYRKAIKKFSYPSQNFAFASRENDIALTVQGNMPIKRNQQGRFIQNGSDSKNAWAGFLPNERTPYIINPARGFVSSANQNSTDATFPNYYNSGDFRDYRGTVLNQYLSKENAWTKEKMKQLQLNNFSLKAKTAIEAILHNLDTIEINNSKHASILNQFKTWDCNYDSTSRIPGLFDRWYDYFYKLTWDEILNDSTKENVKLPGDPITIQMLNEDSKMKYFDMTSTPQIENGKDIILLALDSLQEYLIKQPFKNWGEYKKASISHMARIPAFGIPFISSSGGADILNAHARTWGPSWRMIVELTQSGPEAIGIYPGGQSGNPGSKYYMNMVERWRTGEYRKLQYIKNPEQLNKAISTIKFN
jgi:penicillin amidase